MKPRFAAAPLFLCRLPELLAPPLAPPPERCLPLPGGLEAKGIVRAWNRFGGLLEPLCARLAVDPGVALAVLCVESGGSGFGPDGRLKIRFEAHLFKRRLAALDSPLLQAYAAHFCYEASRPWLGQMIRTGLREPWQQIHRSQSGEWEALAFARAWHDAAALESTSMGAPQILGSHHAAIGYATARAMIEAFAHPQHGERAQLLGFFDFLQFAQPNARLLAALRALDFTGFAQLYNGPGQADTYAARIAKQLAIWKQR